MAESGGSNSRHLSQTGHNQLLLTATAKQTDTRQPDSREKRELSKIGLKITKILTETSELYDMILTMIWLTMASMR